ncbi:MAG: hypothetical protein L6Q26_10505 [Anaerolineales bacterium]|nr:hypothetical protein [Anaerolineales bacterium]NUQ83380.1 hypothetical protein [Anaerolineales bacterium]
MTNQRKIERVKAMNSRMPRALIRLFGDGFFFLHPSAFIPPPSSFRLPPLTPSARRPSQQ